MMNAPSALPKIAFQYRRNGNSAARKKLRPAIIMGPAETVAIVPTGRKSQGTTHHLSERFSQNRLVHHVTWMAKNHPNMMHCMKGAEARFQLKPMNGRISLHCPEISFQNSPFCMMNL